MSNASNCAGWQQISLKPNTAVYLAGNDALAGKDIASHNAYGRKYCVWGSNIKIQKTLE